MMGGDNEYIEKELPKHRVTVQAFKMMKYEVTQGQWRSVTGRNPARFSSCGLNCPIESVSWKDIQTFIKKLNQKTGLNFRLPNEAEWEYAARAGSTYKYSWGSFIDCSKARYGYYSDMCGTQGNTDPVGSYQPNKFGLYDMHGNVWEWTKDCWNDSYYDSGSWFSSKPDDGSAWESGDCKKRVFRGGSWFNEPYRLRSAFRGGNFSNDRSDSYGFRLVQGR
jgi:formylglycine-generating enzyme required for sulfatase activity